jgi:Protein of unknown function (DUF1353)
MPFLDENGGPLRVIPLRQAPATGPYFQLTERIGFREHPTSKTYWVPAHLPDDNPQRGNRTDLATIPWSVRAFVASYGRQSAPAIMHDHQRSLTARLPPADALARAEEDDRLFRVGLRQQKVPLLRAWLMWGFVSLERHLLYAPRRAALLVMQTVIAAAVIYTAIVLAFVSPLWLLALVVPAIAGLAWGRGWILLLWLSYGFALLAPLLLLQLCSIAPYRLAEFLVRETIDRPFIDPEPGPVVVPFGRAP